MTKPWISFFIFHIITVGCHTQTFMEQDTDNLGGSHPLELSQQPSWGKTRVIVTSDGYEIKTKISLFYMDTESIDEYEHSIMDYQRRPRHH